MCDRMAIVGKQLVVNVKSNEVTPNTIPLAETIKQLQEIQQQAIEQKKDSQLAEEQLRDGLREKLNLRLAGILDSLEDGVQHGSFYHADISIKAIQTIMDLNGLKKPTLKPVEETVKTNIELTFNSQERG